MLKKLTKIAALSVVLLSSHQALAENQQAGINTALQSMCDMTKTNQSEKLRPVSLRQNAKSERYSKTLMASYANRTCQGKNLLSAQLVQNKGAELAERTLFK